MQRLLHKIAEVVADFQRLIVRRDIRIPGHADVIDIRHFILPEHDIHIFHQHFFHTDIADIMSRKIKDIGDKFGYRDDAKHRLFLGLILIFQAGGHIQRLIKQMGKRMVRIHDLRR